MDVFWRLSLDPEIVSKHGGGVHGSKNWTGTWVLHTENTVIPSYGRLLKSFAVHCPWGIPSCIYIAFMSWLG